MKRFLVIALLILVGCASNKPTAEQATATNDNLMCEKFYEFVNKTYSIKEFQELKEAAKEEGLELNEMIDVFEMPIVRTALSSSELCNETITCNQKIYCLSILNLRDSTIMKPFKF